MKNVLYVLGLIFASATLAQTYSHYDAIKKIDSFHGLKGIGSYIKDGTTVEKNEKCSLFVENIDNWSTESTITADILHVYIGSHEVGTDLQGWDPKEVTIQTAAKKITYTNTYYVSSTKCNIVEKLVIAENTSISYSASVQCSDRRRKSYTEEATCKF